jgi:hypothetical protein
MFSLVCNGRNELKGNEGRYVIAKSTGKGDNCKLCFALYTKQSDGSNNGERGKKPRPSPTQLGKLAFVSLSAVDSTPRDCFSA